MNVVIRGYTVYIKGIAGPSASLMLAPKQTLDLLNSLEAKRAQITDLALNYHDCKECGGTHHNDVTVCPKPSEEGEA